MYSVDDLWLLIETKREVEDDLKLATNRLKRAANDIDFYSLFSCSYEELRDIYKHIGNYIEDEDINNDFKQLIEKKKIEKYPELLKPTYYPEINLLNISDEEKLRLDKAARFNLRYYINERNCDRCFYVKSIQDMELLHSVGIAEKKYSFRCECCGCSCLTISEQEMKDYKRIWFLEDKGNLTEEEDEELASLYEKGILAINLYCMDCEDFEVEICNEKDLENYMENVEIVYKVVKEPDLRYEKI